MRVLLTALALASVVATPSMADCYGTGIYRSCTFSNGTSSFSSGSYGSALGYDAQSGTSWSGSMSTYGNTTSYQGMASDGTTFSGQTNDYGRGYSYSSGLDSRGSYYSGFTYGN